jgi:glutathione reductase (NADPH)
MSFAMLDEAHKQPTAYKLVVVGEEEKVVGLHIIGEGSDEIMQGCKYLIISSRSGSRSGC